MFSPLFAYDAKRCQVSGNHTVAAEELCSLFQAEQGTSLLRLDVSQLQKRILSRIPMVESAHVKLSFPHGLQVVVRERKAVALALSQGTTVPVDRHGEVVSGPVPDHLPQIEVDVKHLRVAESGAVVREVLGVLAQLPQDFRNNLARMGGQGSKKLLAISRSGVQILWGDNTDTIRKARVAQLLLSRPGIREIDVSDPVHPATRS